eukprot:CAMPEP_0175923806 /NCGR_PEP_ID=MMETSP0108-20121206/14767_1 /TAXON_ID=195067 ORGANISM="Goniomonas pacifica, Strain CCMP1869" /NCGR_SAMPLE_ID=MMETSP0108 /ASSEMBLY_ACC=CAM_ASM_000204 /LENGTH=202 /DNA_ID=CAMNT_0017246831 /DNA_START=1 /DNA_END=610 /DNA_ORIENTATION=-
MDYPLNLRSKVVVVGDASVGKSALCRMFYTNGTDYPKNYSMTVGCDFNAKNVAIPDSNVSVELFLFDTSGQGIFKDMFPKFWESASCIMLVYDAPAPRRSRIALSGWSKCEKLSKRDGSQASEECEPAKPFLPVGVLVANKIDLEDRMVIHANVGVEFAEQNGLEFFQCSAATNDNVEAPFQHLANNFHQAYEEKLELLSAM